jgi:hypothetical protein
MLQTRVQESKTGAAEKPFIPIRHISEHVLEYLKSRPLLDKTAVWNEARALIEKDGRVQTTERLYTNEQQSCWTWIGAVTSDGKFKAE